MAAETVTVRFEIEIPDVDATDEQISDWISYGLQETSALDGDNPLCDYELEAKFGTVDIQ